MQDQIERSLKENELPALRAIEDADFLSYTTRECQERIFCEVSRIGRSKDSSLIQKLMYLAANLWVFYHLGKLIVIYHLQSSTAKGLIRDLMFIQSM